MNDLLPTSLARATTSVSTLGFRNRPTGRPA